MEHVLYKGRCMVYEFVCTDSEHDTDESHGFSCWRPYITELSDFSLVEIPKARTGGKMYRVVTFGSPIKNKVEDTPVLLNLPLDPQCQWKQIDAFFVTFKHFTSTQGMRFSTAIEASQITAIVKDILSTMPPATTLPTNSVLRINRAGSLLVKPTAQPPTPQERRGTSPAHATMSSDLSTSTSITGTSNTRSKGDIAPPVPDRKASSSTLLSAPPVPPRKKTTVDHDADIMTPRSKQKSLALHREVQEWQDSTLSMHDSEIAENERKGIIVSAPVTKKERRTSLADMFKIKRPPTPVKEKVETTISAPTDYKHVTHIGYDEEKARYTGVPPEWRDVFNLQFGIHLDNVPKIKLPDYECGIPAVLNMLERDLLEKGGASEVGIFRLAPDHDLCEKIKKQINRGEYEGGAPVHVLANLIKVFYRELPPNLLNILDEDTLISASEQEPATIGMIVHEFPEPNRSSLLWLLDLMVKISMKENENKMGIRNLAICMAPNCFSLEETVDPMRALVVSQKVAALIINMVKWRYKELHDIDIE